ncbi:MAG: phage integrase N-terminal SAM-like domain-containing protein [Chloroflexota bacterium]
MGDLNQPDQGVPADTPPIVELSDSADQATPKATAKSTLIEALEAFKKHMQDEGFAVNTVKSFAIDIRLLHKYLGDKPIGEIDTEDLNKFLNWLQYERGVPCSPKTYSRRVTTLKVFFNWLNKSDLVVIDPAKSVAQKSVSSPLPSLPNESQIARALQVTDAWFNGQTIAGLPRKRDTRPHVLLNLLLQTGIKKGETKGIHLEHIERDDVEAPQIFIRYNNIRMRYKERRIAIEPSLLNIIDAYVDQYGIIDELFTCTARNLEYIIKDAGAEAELEPSLISFENLRWVSALLDLKNGVDHDLIREKLGLSKITWRETKHKLERLLEKEQESESESQDEESTISAD